MSKKVSVIIPVYNVEQYLDECVSKTIHQTYQNIEVVLVDDGSSDSSSDLCNKWEQRDPRIHTIHKRNGGLSSARNVGINSATGDYIIFLDSDDYFRMPTVIEALINRVTLSNADVLCFNYCKVNNNHEESAAYFRNQNNMPLFHNSHLSFKYISNHNLWIACAWNKLIKRELFDDDSLYFIEKITSEDIDWSARLATKSVIFDFINDCCICYRQRPESISHSVTPEKANCLLSNIAVTKTIINCCNPQRKLLLLPYLSYQVGTSIISVSLIEDKQIRQSFYEKIKVIASDMRFSKMMKVRFLWLSTKTLGIAKTVDIIRKLYK